MEVVVLGPQLKSLLMAGEGLSPGHSHQTLPPPTPQGSSQCRPSEAPRRDPCFSPSVTAFFKTPESKEPMWVLEG